MANFILKLSAFVGTLCVLVGGALAIFGAVQPWANAILFGSIHVSLPGLAFILGAAAAACGVASICFLRFPLVCMLLGAVLLADTALAVQQIPHAVRGGLIDVQRSFFPINELLDKFDLETVMVGNYGAKDADYLGIGITRTSLGGSLILLGGLLSLPRDPAIKAGGRRFLKEKCRACGSKWRLSREALFCPKCSAPTPRSYNHCRNCSSNTLPHDKYCVKCGYPVEQSSPAITR